MPKALLGGHYHNPKLKSFAFSSDSWEEGVLIRWMAPPDSCDCAEAGMFGSSDLFSKTQFLLERSMDASLIRRSVISDNIANVDTPHFKRGEVTFESQMKRALDSELRDVMPAKMTNVRHIPFKDPIDYRGVRARIRLEHDTNYRNDKNNVDIEKEIVDATKNMLMYNAMAQRVDRNYKMISMLTR